MKVPISVSFDYDVYQALVKFISENKEQYRSVSNFVNTLCSNTMKECEAQKTKPQTKKKGTN